MARGSITREVSKGMTNDQRPEVQFDFGGIDAMFNASSVAIFGASSDPVKIGGRPVRFFQEGPFQGPIYPINSRRDEVQGLRAYPSLQAIEAPIDLALLAIPGADVVETLEECAEAGVRSAVVFSAGFAETGKQGAAAQQRIKEIARKSQMRILGPNCIGAANSATGVFATFSAISQSMTEDIARQGVAFVSQSGAVGPHCLTVARTMGLDFPVWATTGNEADLQLADLIAYLAQHEPTRAIAVYMEGCSDGERLKAALALAHDNQKPVIVLKAGRSEIGAQAVASHTAALVGSDDIYNAVFEAYGVCRVRTIEEMIATSYACAIEPFPTGPRLGILTGSGGVGILMSDYAEELGLEVSPLPEEAQRKLLELWPPAGVRNPIDTTAQATSDPSLLMRFLEVVVETGQYDTIVVFLTYLGLLEPWSSQFRDMLVEARRRWPDTYMAVSMLATPTLTRELSDAGMVCYPDPADMLGVISRLVRLSEHLGSPLMNVDVGAVPHYDGRVLREHEALELLGSADIPIVPTRVAKSSAEASDAATELGYPVVLKILSADIQHKSDVGGVAIGLDSANAVTAAYRDVTAAVRGHLPNVELDGVLVMPQISGGVETIIGVHNDPTFGPIVVFGLGGVMVEAIGEVEYRLAPLTTVAAEEMIRNSASYRVLRGVRGAAPADVPALARVISSLSVFAAANASTIESIDLNPVIARPDGAVVVDALIVPRQVNSADQHV